MLPKGLHPILLSQSTTPEACQGGLWKPRGLQWGKRQSAAGSDPQRAHLTQHPLTRQPTCPFGRPTPPETFVYKAASPGMPPWKAPCSGEENLLVTPDPRGPAVLNQSWGFFGPGSSLPNGTCARGSGGGGDLGPSHQACKTETFHHSLYG